MNVRRSTPLRRFVACLLRHRRRDEEFLMTLATFVVCYVLFAR